MLERANAGLERLDNLRRSALAIESPRGAAAAAASPVGVGGLGRASSLPVASTPHGGSDVAQQPWPPEAEQGDYAGMGGVEPYVPTRVRALYAFDAEAEGELSVAAGDALWVSAEVDGWYQVTRDGDGASGLVPSSYVQVEQL
jgi:SH3 domain